MGDKDKETKRAEIEQARAEAKRLKDEDKRREVQAMYQRLVPHIDPTKLTEENLDEYNPQTLNDKAYEWFDNGLITAKFRDKIEKHAQSKFIFPKWYNHDRYEIVNNSLWYLDGEKPPVPFCMGTPFYIDGIIQTRNANILVLKAFINKRNHRIEIPQTELMGSNIKALCDKGFNVPTSKMKYVNQYVEYLICNNEFPREMKLHRWGWYHENNTSIALEGYTDDPNAFCPYDLEMHGTLAHVVKPSGSAEDELKFIYEQFQHSDYSKIAIGASLASPLLHLIGSNNFIVNFNGISESGKTSLQFLGAKLWGNCQTMTHSFNSTIVGMEILAGVHNHLPLFLNELMSNMNSQSSKILYMLSEGQNKGRGTRDVDMRNSISWNNITITSGEKTLLDGEVRFTGEQNRLIEVYVPLGCVATNWTTFHKYIKDKNYGNTGKILIDLLKQPGNMDNLRDIFQEIKASISDSRLTNKQQQAFSVLALGMFAFLWAYEWHKDNSITIKSAKKNILKILYEITTSEFFIALLTDEDNNQKGLGDKTLERLFSWCSKTPKAFSKDERYSGVSYGEIEWYEGKNYLFITNEALNIFFEQYKLSRTHSRRALLATKKCKERHKRFNGMPTRGLALEIEKDVEEAQFIEISAEEAEDIETIFSPKIINLSEYKQEEMI